MTLQEAENDKRFQQFKFCGFLDLVSYILKCETYMQKNPDDKDIAEYLEAARLIKNSRGL